MFLSVEIKNLLRKRVIKECQHKEGEYISPIFLTLKSDDHMPDIHFKMDNIKSAPNSVTPNDFMAKNDIKDACYSISILAKQQKFLKFSLQ